MMIRIGIRRLYHSSPTIGSRTLESNSLRSTDNVLDAETAKSLNLKNLTDLKSYRQSMNSVMKDLFSGKLTKVLSYPDVLPKDRYFALESDVNDVVSKEDPSYFHDFDTSEAEGFRVDRDFFLKIGVSDGRGVTEIARLWEELASQGPISKSEALFSHRYYGIQPLLQYGSPDQKERYLTPALKGECKIGICIRDHSAGSDVTSTDFTGLETEDGKGYVLHGEKLTVVNGWQAGLLIVFGFAVTRQRGNADIKQFVAFMVPSDTPGIEKSYSNNSSKNNGIQTCDFRFTNVYVRKEDLLGVSGRDVLANAVFTDESRIFTATRISSTLRNLLNKGITHSMTNKRLDDRICHSRTIRNKIALAASKIYALESMSYMTAGLADYQSEPDFGLDALSCKLYANVVSRYVVENVFDIIGDKGLAKNESFYGISRDLESYTLWEGTDAVLKIFLAGRAIRHASENIELPSTSFRRFQQIRNEKASLNKKRWDLYKTLLLKHKVHPSFEPYADITENAILHLNIECRRCAKEENDIAHIRLAHSGVLVHSMFCALLRASRSYSYGQRHFDLEKYLCKVHIEETEKDIKNLLFNQKNVFPSPMLDEITKILVRSRESNTEFCLLK